MLTKIHIQPRFPLQFNRVPKEFLQHQKQYERINDLLDANRGIIEAVFSDLAEQYSPDGRSTDFSAEQRIRMIIVKNIEGLSLRDTTIRIADSDFFRTFTRLFSGPVPGFTTVQSAIKCIQPTTWERINAILFRYAKKENLITGTSLRVDSTVSETNIHYPTDVSLLWDSYRTIARLIRQCI